MAILQTESGLNEYGRCHNKTTNQVTECSINLNKAKVVTGLFVFKVYEQNRMDSLFDNVLDLKILKGNNTHTVSFRRVDRDLGICFSIASNADSKWHQMDQTGQIYLSPYQVFASDNINHWWNVVYHLCHIFFFARSLST